MSFLGKFFKNLGFVLAIFAAVIASGVALYFIVGLLFALLNAFAGAVVLLVFVVLLLALAMSYEEWKDERDEIE